MDGLLKQISALAAPGSRLCFDALHRTYMDGARALPRLLLRQRGMLKHCLASIGLPQPSHACA